MKSNLKYTLTIVLTVICFNLSFAQKKVKGNGTIITKTHTTSDYDAIHVIGFMNVILEKGNEGTITVKTDENLQEYIIVESKNGILTLKVEKGVNLNTKKGVHLTVPFTDISELSLTGSGDVLNKDVIKTNLMEVELTGSGDMTLDIEATGINAKLTGSGDMEISGKVTDFEIKVTGSGDFVSKSLMSQNTEAYVSGSGDATVYASNRLKARVHGSGDIKYVGNPETTDLKVLGSGDIGSN